MSRSRKRTPVLGVTTAESEKDDKIRSHKKFRRKTRQFLKEEKEILPEKMWEVLDPWSMAKDGAVFYKNPDPKYLRK